MRLINADTLLEKVWDVDCRCGYVQVVDRADIETAPTIDPEDLRPRGRWEPVDHDGSWRVDKCSICHRRMHYVNYDQPYQYCPNCGAKMEVNNG